MKGVWEMARGGLNMRQIESFGVAISRHRVSVGIGRRNVRLVQIRRRTLGPRLLVGFVAALLIVGICAIVAWIKPLGQVGKSEIVEARWWRRLVRRRRWDHAPGAEQGIGRLITGQAMDPPLVPMSENPQSPVGPSVGSGAP